MLLSIGADERAALQFDDLASALDAGLPLPALGGDPTHGDRVVHGILGRRGVRLSPTEVVVIEHAWRAGRVAAALRLRATERRQRAESARTVWAGLRYPLLLVGLWLAASATTAPIVGPWFLVSALVVVAALAIGLWLLRAAVRRGDPRVARLPLAGRLVADFGELPYLETLHALYGAGVQLAAAHAAAVAAVTAGSVQQRLRIADGMLQRGQPLAEALAGAIALHPETRQLLATGEQTGQLEDALARALARRRGVAVRDLGALARRIGQVAYAVMVVAIVVLVFRFYSGYFGLLRR